MANVAIFQSNKTPVYITSVETSLYINNADALINPADAVTLLANNVAVKYWKRSGETILEMSAGEKTVVDDAIAASNLSSYHSIALSIKDLSSADGIQWRAVALILIDEINILRQWEVSFKAAVAGAGTLAALKTAVAALPDLSDRTLSQLKTSYTNKINSGSAD